MRKFIVGILALFLFGSPVVAATFPQFENFVTDTTDTLSSATIDELNIELASYEAETGTEIAVVLIDSTAGMPISQYATELGNAWGVGKAEADNGAILVVAVDDRELFIATGSQLEGAVTDIAARDIIDEVITPRFREGNFDEGVSAGIQGIFAAIAGESFTDLRIEGADSGSPEGFINIFFVFAFFVLPWLAAILGRSKRIWPGGAIGAVGGGVGGAIFLSGILGIVGAAVGLGLFGLAFDALVSRNYAKAGKRGHVAWWAGGGRGGGFGGGGFGGFGGGGFSGGGFGGRW
ncbi:MAG: TPM domain-containing protein [Candidatus Peribacteraceae bacterium]|nr:TPM domain-containing protein [Candidatus Peribacteraceae bacterium]